MVSGSWLVVSCNPQPTPNNQHPTPNTQHPTPNTQQPLRGDARSSLPLR
ncbi:MAG: hypothetical protein ACHBN1_15255 [Heteroscytonema crispum UTEX LB 1556]